jgi:hypothetical protein
LVEYSSIIFLIRCLMKNALLLSALLVFASACFGQDTHDGERTSPRTYQSDSIRSIIAPRQPDRLFQKGARQLSHGLLLIAAGSLIAFFGPLAVGNRTGRGGRGGYNNGVRTVQYIGGGIMAAGGIIGAAGAIKIGKVQRQRLAY